jgi:hypothetical protein
MIDHKEGIANLHELNQDEACYSIDNNQKITYALTGSLLLKMAIKFIESVKDEYKLKFIQLTDNALKYCGYKRINLSDMYMLLNGDTWYGKYGFIPIKSIDTKSVVENKDYLNLYSKNKKIIDKTYVYHIENMEQYLLDSLRKNNININKNHIKNYVNKYRNLKLSDFLRKFLKNYDKNCKLFEYFYKKIIGDLGMKSFVNNIYIYPLDLDYVKKFYGK